VNIYFLVLGGVAAYVRRARIIVSPSDRELLHDVISLSAMQD